MKKTKKFLKLLKKLWNDVDFILGITKKARRDAVDLGLVDYSGQGRNKYGF